MRSIKSLVEFGFVKVKNALVNQDGMGTVEVVVIVVVLIGIALMFRNGIQTFVGDLLGNLDASKLEIEY